MSSDLYAAIKNRFLDMMDSANPGGNVSDVALSHINSAQQRLTKKHFWQGLIKEYELAANADAQALPSDFDKVKWVGYDSDGDGYLEQLFFNQAIWREVGYKMRNSFAKATGDSWTIEFFASPSSAPTLIYQVKLDAFTGSGDEYSYFPLELIIAEAHLVYLQESGRLDNEYDRAKVNRDEILDDYKQSYQYNNSHLANPVVDFFGNPIIFDSYSMTGDISNNAVTGYDRDYDLRHTY